MNGIMDKLHEECGVFGIVERETSPVVSDAYYGLYALQHRGQESCGIAVNDYGVITSHKDTGLVGDVFTDDVVKKLGSGQMAIGHCRYATTGAKSRRNAQPMVISHIKGTMAIAHNGNLTNAAELREELEMEGAIFHSTSDTEVIAYIITKQRITSCSIEEAIFASMDKLKGAYSLVIMSPRKLVAVRDPHGFRPLCMGTTQSGGVVFASESCALEAIGAKFERDILPGEMVVVKDGEITSYQKENLPDQSVCVFEFIYFARSDSVIDQDSVHLARQKAGESLARRHPVDADVVIGVPDSGLDAALGYSKESKIPYGIGFLKNKYIGRTFIAPNQKQRENSVRIKLTPIAAVVKDKRVVLIDDSIVRGTTSLKIVNLLREAGAKEVHMRLSSPPFLYPCYFGTDIDSSENLIAYKHTIEEIREIIGVDSLGYLDIEDLEGLAASVGGICKGCFTGKYPISIPQNPNKNKFEKKIMK